MGRSTGQQPHWGSYGREGSSWKKIERYTGFSCYDYISHWLTTNSLTSFFFYCFLKKLYSKAIVPMSYALRMALLITLFTSLWRWTNESPLLQTHRAFLIPHELTPIKKRMKTGRPLGYVIRTVTRSVDDDQEAVVKSKPFGARPPRARVPGRPWLHRGAEALAIFPINLSQLASETYLFLVLRTQASSCCWLGSATNLPLATNSILLMNCCLWAMAWIKYQRKGTLGTLVLTSPLPAPPNPPCSPPLPLPIVPTALQVLAGANLIFMVSRAWNANRRCAILHCM